MHSLIGNFNAESFWRDDHLATLPAMRDEQGDRIIGVMDELQMAFCEGSEDQLITRFPISEILLEYISGLGIQFSSMSVFSTTHSISSELLSINVFQALKDNGQAGLICSGKLSPFAVIPHVEALLSPDQQFALPGIAAVKQVNSKAFSHQLTAEIFGRSHGVLTHSAGELVAQGKRYLNEGAIVVKEVFGVSGKGNLKIDSERLLLRIEKHLKKQEEQGKQATFVVEPFLQKELDFSCLLYVHPDGNITITSTHQFSNNGFSFSGSTGASEAFMEWLSDKGYYEIMVAIGKKLYESGYFGEVGVDSMKLSDQTIVPIVEINARKSMSLINHCIETRFKKSNTLVSFSASIPPNIKFENVFKTFHHSGILFHLNSESGLIPLSANTLDINSNFNGTRQGGSYRGKFYGAVMGSDQQQQYILKEANRCFQSLGINIG